MNADATWGRCLCDRCAEARAGGIHRAACLDNGLGGYECVCGQPTPEFCPRPSAPTYEAVCPARVPPT